MRIGAIGTDVVALSDGIISVAHGDTITAEYSDADDGGGSPAVVQATAYVDCLAPSITNVQVGSITETSAVVSWDTDEPASSSVTLDGPGGTVVVIDPALVTSHSVNVSLVGCVAYTFSVASTDEVGNQALSLRPRVSATTTLPAVRVTISPRIPPRAAPDSLTG